MSGRWLSWTGRLESIAFGPFLEHAVIGVPATYLPVTTLLVFNLPGLRSMGEVCPTQDALTAWQNICLC